MKFLATTLQAFGILRQNIRRKYKGRRTPQFVIRFIEYGSKKVKLRTDRTTCRPTTSANLVSNIL